MFNQKAILSSSIIVVYKVLCVGWKRSGNMLDVLNYTHKLLVPSWIASLIFKSQTLKLMIFFDRSKTEWIAVAVTNATAAQHRYLWHPDYHCIQPKVCILQNALNTDITINLLQRNICLGVGDANDTRAHAHFLRLIVFEIASWFFFVLFVLLLFFFIFFKFVFHHNITIGFSIYN